MRKRAEAALEQAQAQLKAHAADLGKTVAARTAELRRRTAEREALQNELLRTSECEKQTIAQEAVTNARKHGEASRVLITLKNSSGGITLSIRDNGVGIPHNRPVTGIGMKSMNHRATQNREMVGGETLLGMGS